MCYASSSQLFLTGNTAEQESFVLNGVAVAALGTGILGQSAISSLCVWNSSAHIPSWSSNPLNTTLVCMHFGLRRNRNRRMLSIFGLGIKSSKIALPRQVSACSARPAVRYVIRFLWALLTIFVIWAIVVLLISHKKDRVKLSAIVDFYGAGVPALQFNLSALMITMSIQVWVTLGLHCMEMLVSVFRDEEAWRHATTARGTKSNCGPFGSIKSAASSWPSVFLFILKTLTHWLFGLSMNEKGGIMFMNWEGIFLLALAISMLPLFVTYYTRRSPRGMQPAAYGNLQRLANLIDDWGNEKDTLWWGEKEASEQGDTRSSVRQVGTSTHRLPLPTVNTLYEI